MPVAAALNPAPVESDQPALTVTEVFAAQASGAPKWMDRAVCASGEHDPELWWPHRGQNAAAARQLCATCPVVGDCRDHFTGLPGKFQQDGIWAGLPADQLRAATRTRHLEQQQRRDGSRRRDRGLRP
jgi:WhiB family redox-sensing transcriptional regulator